MILLKLFLIVMNFSLMYHICCSAFVPFTLSSSVINTSLTILWVLCPPLLLLLHHQVHLVLYVVKQKKKKTISNTKYVAQLPHLLLYIVVTKPRAQPNNMFYFSALPTSEWLFVLESLQKGGKGCSQQGFSLLWILSRSSMT